MKVPDFVQAVISITKCSTLFGASSGGGHPPNLRVALEF
jgi:hypothetical protein